MEQNFIQGLKEYSHILERKLEDLRRHEGNYETGSDTHTFIVESIRGVEESVTKLYNIFPELEENQDPTEDVDKLRRYELNLRFSLDSITSHV